LTTVSANAASLYGRVDQVDEGDVITVINLNRPIKIRLLGIDAPEKDQPYADVARQHLAHLVLNKFVVVHYSGLGGNSYILGRVVAGETDVCAQMLRDGVAWFDNTSRLNEAERETYILSERAARSEKRGLWEDATPVAPWEFKRSIAERRSLRWGSAPKQTSSRTSLSSEDLFNAVGSTRRTSAGSYSGWKTITPSDFNFSVMMPGNAVEKGFILPIPNGGSADINLSIGSEGLTTYMVLWGKGPHDGTPDSVVTESTVAGFTAMLNRSLERQGKAVQARVERQRPLKNGGFSGTQYRLSAAGVTVGLIRVFTKHNGKERQLYFVVVVDGEERDPQVSEFLESLTLNQKK
jgi:endonuclease YncB( thermonuclease family)